jgi:hypothetical protein
MQNSIPQRAEKNVGNYTKLVCIFILPFLGGLSLGLAAKWVSTVPVGIMVFMGVWALFTGIQVGLFQKKL